MNKNRDSSVSGAGVLLSITLVLLLVFAGCDAKSNSSPNPSGTKDGNKTPAKKSSVPPVGKSGDQKRPKKGLAPGKVNKPGPLVKSITGSATPRWRRVCVHSGNSLNGIVARANGDWVLTSRRKIQIFAATSGQLLRSFKLEKSPAGIALGPKRNLLAVGSSSGTIEVWDLNSGKKRQFVGHKGLITGLAINPAGTRLASSSQDETVRIWNLANQKSVHTIKSPEKNNFHSIAFDPTGKTLVAGGYKMLHFIDPASGVVLKSIPGPGGGISSLSFRPDGKQLAVGGSSQVQLIEPASYKVVTTHKGYQNPAAFSRDGKLLLLTGKDGKVELRDVKSSKLIFSTKLSADAYSLAFGPGSNALAIVARFDHTLHVFSHDQQPDLGLWLTGGTWYGKELWFTLQIAGKLPARSIGYGRLKLIKAVDDQGKSFRIESSIPVMQGFSNRNRNFPGTGKVGFGISLRIVGLSPAAKRISQLQGSIDMRVPENTTRITFKNLGSLVGKPLAHSQLKKLGMTVVLKPSIKGKGMTLTYKSTGANLENVEIRDDKGKKRGISSSTSFGSNKQWSISQDKATLANWSLELVVNSKINVLRGQFKLTNLIVPPRKK